MHRLVACFLLLVVCALSGWWIFGARRPPVASRFVVYRADLARDSVRLYWKDKQGRNLRSLHQLQTWLAAQGQKLVFAMNAGMYKPDLSPQGLYIEDGKVLAPLDTGTGKGNFYLQPNGVFYITNNRKAGICATSAFRAAARVRFATQSGPLLLLEGRMHPVFRPGSTNVNIRNGVGILPNGAVVFAMSKEKINFYDFAAFFQQLGCRNALYLDGLVSRTYLPAAQWEQTDGDFGVLVGITAATGQARR